MSKIHDLNKELKRLNDALMQGEAKFHHIDLNSVQQLKPRIIERVSNTVYIGSMTQKRDARAKDQKAIDKFFAHLTYSKLLRLKAQSFGKRLIFGDKHIMARLSRRVFDINQNIESFFLTKEKIYKDNLEAQQLKTKLQDIQRIGYGGFLSSKPSKSQYEEKVKETSYEISRLTISHSQSLVRDEEFLLSLCKISHMLHNEVRSIDSKISDIKKQLRELKKEETYNLKIAKAAAFDNEARKQAKGLKSKIEKQVNCPYCSNKIDGESHLDHIHPLSKGGLNIAENLVDCCAKCNLKKSDKGVFQFCKDQGYDYEQVCNRLLTMGKHI
ncbi:HNH endonuclease [Amylibacter sp.]|nr:HNH endonuclease [Amylibacter sp.]